MKVVGLGRRNRQIRENIAKIFVDITIILTRGVGPDIWEYVRGLRSEQAQEQLLVVVPLI